MEEKKETFLAKIGQGWRITVPYPVRKWLDLKQGDIIRVRIVEQKDNKEE